MTDDAGFAAALTARQSVLRDALLLAYARESFSRRLAIPVLGEGPPASINAFLKPPQVTCDGARNALVLSIDLLGALSITESGTTQAMGVDASLDVAVPPQFTLSNGELALSPTPVDVIVTRWTFDVVFGSGFPPGTDAYLRSDVFRRRLQDTIQFALEKSIIPLPSVPISFTGVDKAAQKTAPDGKTASVPGRVVDGAVMAGINVNGYRTVGGDTITLVGDAAALNDFARSYDAAVVVNAGAVPILLEEKVEKKIVDAVGTSAKLNGPLVMVPVNGQFDVSGSASNSSGTAHFSFAIVPHLTAYRPGALITNIKPNITIKPRQWPGLWFSTEDVNVDVEGDALFWEGVVFVIAGAMALGFMLECVRGMEEAMAYGYRMQIAGQSSGDPVALVQRVTSAALGDVTLRISVDDYEITPAGTYTGVTIIPEPAPPALIGPRSIPADLRSDVLSYRVRLPVGVVADDPTLWLQWTVIDPASGTVYVDDDRVALERETFTFVPDHLHPGLSTYAVGCRVYHKLGSQSTDVFNDGIDLAVGPPLKPRAYVRWHYEVQNPGVQFDHPSDSWRYLGNHLAHRVSNIHRTDHPCKMAVKVSRWTFQTELLDALPFPASEIDTHRKELCDYCFYGGPAGLRASL